MLAVGIYLIALVFAGTMLGSGRATPLYGWFAAFCLFSVLQLTYFLTHDPALEGWVPTAYFLGSNLQMSALVAMALYLTQPQRNRTYIKLNMVVGAFVFLMLAGIAINPVQLGYIATVATNLFFLFTSPVVLYGLYRYWSHAPNWHSAWVCGLAVGSFLLTLHDVWHVVVLVENPRLQLSHLSPILMVAAFWWVVAHERLSHLAALHRAGQEQLAALHRQRKEIKRDLHDGVTSQLASLVLMARRKHPEFVPFLQESLEDLRTIMDEIDTRPDELRAILDDVQPKLDSVLEGHGVVTEWHVAISQGLMVGSQARRAIYLGLEECVHNALRHAEPTRISFVVASHKNTISLEINDNGSGFADPDAVMPMGHGLAGLQERLSSLGGSISLTTNRGARIRLVLPLREYYV